MGGVFGFIQTLFVLGYYFFLSLNHDWIEPRVHNFNQMHAAQIRERVRRDQIRRDWEEAKRARKKEVTEKLQKQREELQRQKQTEVKPDNILEQKTNQEVPVQIEIDKDDPCPLTHKLSSSDQDKDVLVTMVDKNQSHFDLVYSATKEDQSLDGNF